MFSSDLCVSKQLHMEESTDMDDVIKKRRTKLWVTDCVCIKELNKLVIGTANRDLQFFDLASPHCSQQFHLYGKIDSNIKIPHNELLKIVILIMINKITRSFMFV